MENISDAKQSLLSIINASGFLFQLRVEKEIQKLRQQHDSDWKVILREHRWVDPIDSSERFIDLVAQQGSSTMVIECKRVQDAKWIFLGPDTKRQFSRARLFWTYLAPDDGPMSGWEDFSFSSSSPESSFCIVRGKGEGDTPMLERLASIVVRSAEILAGEVLRMGVNRRPSFDCFYIPVIVTNAELYVSRFTSDTIDLQTGMLPDAEFEAVPMVRFRKALSTTISSDSDVSSLSNAAERNERTILVINSRNLNSILIDSEISLLGSNRWPWDVVPIESM